MRRACHECGEKAQHYGVYCLRCLPLRSAATQKAMTAVSVAVRDGLLPSLRESDTPCTDCGKRATCYDHRDYAKPLEVEPVCRSCNAKRGPAAPLRVA